MQIDCMRLLGYSRFAFWLYPAQTQTKSDDKRIHHILREQSFSSFPFEPEYIMEYDLTYVDLLVLIKLDGLFKIRCQ